MSRLLLGLLWIPVATAQPTIDELPCLYSITIGASHTPISSCDDVDPANLGKDPRILVAMQILGVPASAVRFRGCPALPFKAIEDVRFGNAKRFIVSYPAEVHEKLLAPVVHELAHVMQMRSTGGVDQLKKQWTSLQIELTADFLVGHVFARAFKSDDRDQFQHNLMLVGGYFDKPSDAHGKPAERTAAFRIGAVNEYPYKEFDAVRGSTYFIQNDFSFVTSP